MPLKALLGSFAISGHFTKTTGSEDIKKLVGLASGQGFSTIVAVGGDGTVKEVAENISDDSVLGIIPMGTTNELSEFFGIKSWKDSAMILAMRRVASIRAVSVGENKMMIKDLRIGALRKPFDLKILADDNVLEARVTALSIENNLIKNMPGLKLTLRGNRDDDKTTLTASRISIISPKPLPMSLDGESIIEERIDLDSNRHKSIKVIVGKDRRF